MKTKSGIEKKKIGGKGFAGKRGKASARKRLKEVRTGRGG
jgi:hypothetical protein